MFLEVSVAPKGFPDGTMVKNLPANAGDTKDMSLIPGSGRSSGEENVLIRYYNSLKKMTC